MKTAGRLARRMQDALWRTGPQRGPVVNATFSVLRFVVVIVRASQDPGLNLRAMGLVYNTLLSLVPLLAVSFSVLKAFGAHYRIEPFLARALEPVGAKGEEITTRVVEFVNNTQVGGRWLPRSSAPHRTGPTHTMRNERRWATSVLSRRGEG